MLEYIFCDKNRIQTSSIIWLEGDWNYTRIYQIDQTIYLSSYTLKWYERILPSFVRVRKDAIVNPLYVHSIQRLSSRPRKLQLMLSDGKLIEVARRRQAMTRRLLTKTKVADF